MALTLSKTGIEQDQTINAWHVTQSIDAFAGTVAYDITLSGSLDISNSTNTGDLVGTASWAENAVSSSYAVTASHALDAVSSSYAITASYALDAVTASFVATASKANNIRISNLPTNNIDYRLTFVSPTNIPDPSGADYTQLVVDSGSDGSGIFYNPSTDTLTTTNFVGTASIANTASFAETYADPTFVDGPIYPSGSVSIPGSALKIIAGASQTDGTSTVVVTVNDLIGKSLNQNCFITAMAEDASPGAISIDPSSPPPNLSFKSQNPNTKFHFHILYV